MSEEQPVELNFKELFQSRVQPLVDLLSSTSVTQFYLNRRREGTSEYSNIWDIVLVDPNQETAQEEPVKKSKKTRAKKST